jgi:hypothetical protein
MEVGNIAIVENDIVDHQPAQFFPAASRVEDEDRNEIQRAVKDQALPLRTRRF